MGLVLGIDVGFSGAIALYNAKQGQLVVADMPISPISKLSKTQNLAIPELVKILKKHAAVIDLAVVEKVHAFSGQGVVSTFRFGEQFGIIQGILGALAAENPKLKTMLVEPAVWKGTLNVTHDKKTSLVLARKVFAPTELFARMKDHGRAEASLLAWYGAKLLASRHQESIDSATVGESLPELT